MQLCSSFFSRWCNGVRSINADWFRQRSSTSLHPCCDCEAATKLWEIVEAADDCDDPSLQLCHKFFGNVFGEGFTPDSYCVKGRIFHQKPGTFCGIPPTETLLGGEVATLSYLQSTLIQKVVQLFEQLNFSLHGQKQLLHPCHSVVPVLIVPESFPTSFWQHWKTCKWSEYVTFQK